MNPNPATECPYCNEIKRDLRDIKEVQRTRACDAHRERLVALEASDEKQWDVIEGVRNKISQVSESVWYQRGVMAAAAAGGSVLGTVLIKLLFK